MKEVSTEKPDQYAFFELDLKGFFFFVWSLSFSLSCICKEHFPFLHNQPFNNPCS